METMLVQVENAKSVDSRGTFDDGWCEGVVLLELNPLIPCSQFRLSVWLPERQGGAQARFSIHVGIQKPVEFQVTRGEKTVIAAPCHGRVGDRLFIKVACDSRENTGSGDLRALSFVADGLAVF